MKLKFNLYFDTIRKMNKIHVITQGERDTFLIAYSAHYKRINKPTSSHPQYPFGQVILSVNASYNL